MLLSQALTLEINSGLLGESPTRAGKYASTSPWLDERTRQEVIELPIVSVR